MNFIIGQIISVLALIISIVIAQFRDVKHILIGECVANLSIALSYVFLGGFSGAWICIIASIQSFVIYWANKQKIETKKRNIISVIFVGVYVVGTAFVYRGWGDIISCMCAMLYVLAIVQKDTKKYRWFMVANSLLWVIYDLATMAYVNMITHGMLLLSLVIAMIRLDRKCVKK